MNCYLKSGFLRGILSTGIFLLCFFAFGQLFAQTEVEPNNEPGQANALTLNKEMKGFANEDGDDDWYALTIPAPGLDILVIEVSAISEVNLILRLYDAKKPDDYLISMDGGEEGQEENR
jgi:hypothetical protein